MILTQVVCNALKTGAYGDGVAPLPRNRQLHADKLDPATFVRRLKARLTTQPQCELQFQASFRAMRPHSLGRQATMNRAAECELESEYATMEKAE